MRPLGGLVLIRLGKGVRLAVLELEMVQHQRPRWRWCAPLRLFCRWASNTGTFLCFWPVRPLRVALVSGHSEHLHAEDEHELERHSNNIKHCHHVLDVTWSQEV